MKEFFKLMRWYNWGAIIPAVIAFNFLVRLFGIDPNAGWANVVGWSLVAFQGFCALLVFRSWWKERKEEKLRDAEFEKETDALREQYRVKRKEFDELCKKIAEEETQ